jgi:hypothetical protein
MEKNKELEKEIKDSSKKKIKEKASNEVFEKPKDKKEKDLENPKLSAQEINTLIEQFTTQQNQRFLQFLRDNTSSIEIEGNFLMKSLESEVDDSPKPKLKNEKEEKLDYMKYEDPEKSKYKSYSPTISLLSDPFEEKSSNERILEEQKSLAKKMFGGGYGKEENEDKYIKPEDIKIDKTRKYLS